MDSKRRTLRQLLTYLRPPCTFRRKISTPIFRRANVDSHLKVVVIAWRASSLLRNVLNIMSIVALLVDEIGFGSQCDTPSFSIDGLLWALVLLRHLVADANDGCVVGVSVEIIVQIFERSVRRFWVKEVYHWQEAHIQHSENCCLLGLLCYQGLVLTNVKLVSKTADTNRSELCADEAEKLIIELAQALHDPRRQSVPNSLRLQQLHLELALPANLSRLDISMGPSEFN